LGYFHDVRTKYDEAVDAKIKWAKDTLLGGGCGLPSLAAAMAQVREMAKASE
jgi:hypothetical protein